MAGLIQQVYINSVRYGFQDVSMQGETAVQYGQIPFLIPKGALGAFNWEAAQESGEIDGNQKGADAATQRYEYRAGQVFVNGIAQYADPST